MEGMNINSNFIEKNYKLIQYLASKLGSNLSKEDREDLVQETVLDLLKAGDKGVEAMQEGASAYVTRLMTNVLIDKGRTDSRDALPCAEVSLDADTDTSAEGDGGFQYHEVIPDKSSRDLGILYRDDIYDLCSRLPPGQAEIFNMRYYLGMTPEEIAIEKGMKNKAVRMTLLRATKNAYKLMDVIEED